MDMKIYIDILVIANMILTFGFIGCTGKITRTAAAPRRKLLAGILGGLSSLIVLIDCSSFLIALLITIIKLGLICGICAVAFSPKSLGRAVLYVFVYLSTELLFGGLCMAMWELSGARIISYRNYTPYPDIPLWLLISCVIVCYAVICIYDRLTLRRKLRAKRFRVRFVLGNCDCFFPGGCDTGNMLEDVFSGSPVIVFASGKLYERFELDSEKGLAASGFHLIPYSTVDGTRLIAVTSKARLYIYEGDRLIKEADCSAGITDSDKSPRAVFNPRILI